MPASENLLAHHAFESMFARLFATVDGARFERRSDLIVALCPAFPIPQFNGAWVSEDSEAAVDAMPRAIAEVEAAGARAWVQTRAGHDRTRQAALELGLTHTEVLPGMVMRRDELVEARASLPISLIADEDADETNDLLAVAFEAPKELFEQFRESLRRIEEVSWYVGRVDGAIVSTAVGFTVEGVTGVFNVATPPGHRGRGYGSAVTSRVLRDAFDTGSQLAFLQTSELGSGVYRRLGFRSGEEYLLLTGPFS
jgi:ribosomal protein S18 acetylase RimI-like enzyme